MTEREQRDLLEWLDEIDRGLRRVQVVLLTTLAYLVGLTATIVMGVM